MGFWERLFSDFKFSILSMSKPLDKIYDTVSAQYKNIVEHLLKLYFFRDTPWRHDWVLHTWKALFWVDRRKGVNKYPLQEWIFHVLWEESSDIWGEVYYSFTSLFVKELTDVDTSVMQENPCVQETADFVRSYMFWLSGQLATSVRVPFEDVEAEIDRLLGEFPFIPKKDRPKRKSFEL
jgi:hypothetical protein